MCYCVKGVFKKKSPLTYDSTTATYFYLLTNNIHDVVFMGSVWRGVSYPLSVCCLVSNAVGVRRHLHFSDDFASASASACLCGLNMTAIPAQPRINQLALMRTWVFCSSMENGLAETGDQ